MIVIIEGVDGSGKSELCAAVSKLTGIPTYKPTVTPMEGTISVGESQAHDRGTIELAALNGGDIIFDRSFPSEWVYGTVYGRKFDAFLITQLDAIVADNGFGVLLRFGSAVRAMKRADAHVTGSGVMQKLIKAYDTYVEKSGMTWLVLDALAPRESNVLEVVKAMRRP